MIMTFKITHLCPLLRVLSEPSQGARIHCLRVYQANDSQRSTTLIAVIFYPKRRRRTCSQSNKREKRANTVKAFNLIGGDIAKFNFTIFEGCLETLWIGSVRTSLNYVPICVSDFDSCCSRVRVSWSSVHWTT
jgi:hypothetical protein